MKQENKDRATIIAIANQKGGVGKTTTTISIATALQQMGKKVLMVDFDPQASLTVCQGNLYPDDLPATISDLVDKEIHDTSEADLAPYIRNEKGIEYIPADLSLSLKEIQLVVVPRREYVLKEILERVADRYEYILIDCPPTLQILTVNALTAADMILIPVQAQFLSVKSFSKPFYHGLLVLGLWFITSCFWA